MPAIANLPAFALSGNTLHAEGVALTDIAERFGTPTWVYSRSAIESAWSEFAQATQGRRALVCFAIKANSNLAILDLLARHGAGFDIVSGGELARVLAAGGDPSKIVFSGVGKSREEMRQALAAGVRCFNVESESELVQLDAVAGSLGLTAPISLRVNPDVDAGTHPYISTGLRDNKFGIAHDHSVSKLQRLVRKKRRMIPSHYDGNSATPIQRGYLISSSRGVGFDGHGHEIRRFIERQIFQTLVVKHRRDVRWSQSFQDREAQGMHRIRRSSVIQVRPYKCDLHTVASCDW